MTPHCLGRPFTYVTFASFRNLFGFAVDKLQPWI